MSINRTMVLHETYGEGAADGETGALVTQIGEGDLDDNQFWVSREEAPDLIRMLADAFDLDLEAIA